MTTVKLYNPNDKPFGSLSNNARIPFRLQDQEWNTVTHFVYANLLRGTNRHLIRNTPIYNVLKVYDSLKTQHIVTLSRTILETGTRSLVATNQLFLEKLMSTSNKELIYGSSNTILGRNDKGHGHNLVGKIYMAIRDEEYRKKRNTQAIDKKREEDAEIIKIILLTIILKNKLVVNYDDLNQLVPLSFEEIEDQFRNNVDELVIPTAILLQQYKDGNLSNTSLIDQINKDKDNIIHYVRNYYKDQFKAAHYHGRRRAIVHEFLRQMIIKLYGNTLTTPEQIESELSGQLDLIVYESTPTRKGSQYMNDLYTRIVNLFDEGKLDISKDIVDKFENNIDENLMKRATNDDIGGIGGVGGVGGVSDDFVDEIAWDGDQEHAIDTLPETADLLTTEQQLLQNIEGADEAREALAAADGIDNIPASEETPQYILFTDAVGPYQMFAPSKTGSFVDGSLFYPNLLGYYYVKIIFTIANTVDKLSLTKAHQFILKDDCQTKSLCDLYNIANYLSNYSKMPEIISEIEDRNKVLLLRMAIETKIAEDPNLQALLMANPQQVIRFVYTDRYDPIIGTGPDSKGKNFTGKILDELRSKYFEKRTNEEKLNEDIALLTVLFDKDRQLIEWFYTRAFDIVNTVVLLHFIYPQQSNLISREFVNKTIQFFYNSCNVQFNDYIELAVPEIFFTRIHDVFEQKVRSYMALSSDTELPFKFSHEAIIAVWKYCTFLTYSLLHESATYNQKNVNVFLNNIVLKLTQNDTTCAVKTNLRDIETCIVSAIINVIKNIVIVFNQPFRQNMVFAIASIIVGHTVKLQSKAESEVSNIFTDILAEYPQLRAQIAPHNAEEAHNIVRGLDLIYDYLEKQASDSYDVTRLENQKIMNRIHFFSSMTAQNPHVMLEQTPLSPTSPTSSSSEAPEEIDQNMLARIQIMTQLKPIDGNARPSTELKPAGLGRKEIVQPLGAPFYGAADLTVRPPTETKDFVGSRILFGNDDEKSLMQRLGAEFRDDDTDSSDDDLIQQPSPRARSESNDSYGDYGSAASSRGEDSE